MFDIVNVSFHFFHLYRYLRYLVQLFFYGITLIRYILLTYIYQYHIILRVDKIIHQTSNITILFKFGG